MKRTQVNKFLSLVLCAVMILSVFAAGDANETSTGAEADTITEESTTEIGTETEKETEKETGT